MISHGNNLTNGLLIVIMKYYNNSGNSVLVKN